LVKKLYEKARRFFQVPVFKQYVLADGIYRILFNQTSQKWVWESLIFKGRKIVIYQSSSCLFHNQKVEA